jgi:hypothetical protein
MKTIEPARPRRMSLVGSTLLGVAGPFVAGLICWLWLILADVTPRKAGLIAATLALAALAGVTWQQARARAEVRWRAALDAYAEREETKGTQSRRERHAGPRSQVR